MNRVRTTTIAASLTALGLVAGGLVWWAVDDGPRTAKRAEPSLDGMSLELRSLNFRSLDGSGNHHDQPMLGAAFGPYARTAPARYADGVELPVEHPLERSVSNRVFDDLGENIHSSRGVTHWGYAWGQFILHDMSRGASGDERADLELDTDDPLERFESDLDAIPFVRSA
jgi:Animal haem peroxidase